MVTPSASAALRLITRLNFVGCSIGRSPGFAPLIILSTSDMWRDGETSTAFNAMKPVAASGGSIVANFDVLDDGEDAAGRTGARLLNLAIVALGLGVIGALAFAWSNADGRLRFELQSAATAPKSAQRAAAPQEIERLRGEFDALMNDVKELTETQHQAAHTIAAMKAAEEDLRRHVPPPYWYSNPATLDLAIAKQPQWAGVAPPPRRPATARSESRGPRKREGAARASPASPR